MLLCLVVPPTRLEEVGEVAVERGDVVLVGATTPELKSFLGSFKGLVEMASVSE